ncbi:MAG TPA: acyltransferase family protein, partial [Bryobacteraceae bacterium]|nr:acyltransferase family protein [Bryobacteraceae bacterium]
MTRNTLTWDFRDSLALRGIAIAAITLHNYFHLLSPVRENEFDFDARRVFVFLTAARDPRQIVQSGFSFFGHFGVQVFIFLSAYGLARKYWEHAPAWRLFVWSRIRKIYPLFLAVIFLWAVMLGLPGGATGPLLVFRENAVSLVLTVLGILNLVPGHGFPPVGPWWFIPFIMQFYCLWPLLRRFTMRFGASGLIALSAASWLLVGTFNPIP